MATCANTLLFGLRLDTCGICRTPSTTMASSLPPALAKLLPATKAVANATLNPYPTTLYQTLSRLRNDGVGALVAQRRWDAKNIHGCYWKVTRVKLKDEGRHGRAWGRLIWKGQLKTSLFFSINDLMLTLGPLGEIVSTRDEQIRGGLKYLWKVVDDESVPPPLPKQRA